MKVLLAIALVVMTSPAFAERAALRLGGAAADAAAVKNETRPECAAASAGRSLDGAVKPDALFPAYERFRRAGSSVPKLGAPARREYSVSASPVPPPDCEKSSGKKKKGGMGFLSLIIGLIAAVGTAVAVTVSGKMKKLKK